MVHAVALFRGGQEHSLNLVTVSTSEEIVRTTASLLLEEQRLSGDPVLDPIVRAKQQALAVILNPVDGGDTETSPPGQHGGGL